MASGDSGLQSLEAEIEHMPDATDTLMDEIDQLEKEEGMKRPDGTLPPIEGAAAKYSVPGSPDAAGTGLTGQADGAGEATLAEPEEPELDAEGNPIPKPLVYAEYSYFCIHRDSWIRKATQPILDHPRFDQVSLSVIGFNCLTLAMFDPLDPSCQRTKCIIISAFEFCWTIFFTVEFFFKYLVMGFTASKDGKPGYWSDPWNRLDFIIVCFGAVDFLPGGVEIPGASALRTLRAIRPLRALNKFPSLRILVNLLCETLPQMASVAMLCFFIFFVFGILAVQIWNGLFHQRCFGPDPNTTAYHSFFGDANEDIYVCSITKDQQNGMNSCPADECDNAMYSECRRDGPNPSWGAIHFDHIFAAWVAIFQCITLEAWVDIMYLVQDAYGFWSWLYFVALIIVGAWFAVNLTLVVISAQFGSSKSDQLEAMAAQVVKERIEREKREKKERRERKIHWITKLRVKYTGYVVPEDEVDKGRQRQVDKVNELEAELEALPKGDPNIEKTQEAIDKQDEALKALDTYMGDDDEGAAAGVFTLIDENENDSLEIDEFKVKFKEMFYVDDEEAQALFNSMDVNQDGVLTREEFLTGYVAFKDSQRNWLITKRVQLRRIVMSDDFANLIMGCIALNVVFMAIEYHGQPYELTMVVEGANYFFCMVFAFEMVLKLIGMGPFDYVSDGFNCFDGTIVIVSLVELFGGGGGGLSVLRTFRLVRVVRLISFLPTLQKQISVMIQTMGEVSSFLLILFLFIFIIAIVGMFIYGGQFTWHEDTGEQCDVQKDYADNNFRWRDGCVQDRKNFDTFGWAMITVFQVLTCEDWNAAMYNGVRAWEHLSGSIYFIFLIVFGNYILFNLFVAILIDGFAAPPEDEEEELDEHGNPIVKDEETNPIVDGTAVDDVSKPASGTGAGTGSIEGSIEGSGVGCGGVEVRMNPIVQQRAAVGRPRAQQPLRLIDHLMPGVVGPNNVVMRRRGIWAWGSGRSEPDARHIRTTLGDTWRGPWRRDNADSSSVAGSGMGSGVGEGDQKSNIIEDGVTDVVDMPNGDGDKVEEMTVTSTEADAVTDLSGMAAGEVPVQKVSCFNRDRSLGMFEPESPFRLWCAELVDDKTERGIILDRVVMGTIAFNSLALAMERPAIKDGSAERIFLDVAANFCGFVFLVEFIMKIVAWNFVYGPEEVERKFRGPARYWDEGWNKLDGTLVICSVIDVVLSNIPGLGGGAILSLLKIFRILRALRPLRAVNKLPGLKLVVNCLLASLGPIGTTLIIVGAIFFVFGILGTQLFKGAMWFCDGKDDLPSELTDIRPVANKGDCEYYNNYNHSGTMLTTQWTRQYYNFDNLLQTLLTLFVLCSIDGWVDIMYQGIDAVGPDEEPVEGANDINSLYFIAFLLIGGFLILNMFVGVILENFNQAQEQEEERKKAAIAAGLEEAEPEQGEAALDPLDGDYYLAYGDGCRRQVYNFVKNDTFDACIAAVIMANVTLMAAEHYDPAFWWVMFGKAANYFFSVAFFFEFMVKLIAYGPGLYFMDNWCRFDFFLVLVSIFDIITEFVDASLPINPTILRVARVMRIARILRLMKGQWAEDLRKLLTTVANSLASAGNLGLLLFLLYFISACLGIELFGRLACTDANPCEGMSNKANFENFYMALLTLFRLSTGDNWNGILKDALRSPPEVTPCDFSLDCAGKCGVGGLNCCKGCDDSDDCEENCCANSIMSPMFFTFFILAAQFVMLNLVVAVLMKELGDAEKADAAEQEALEKQRLANEAGADGQDNVEMLPGTGRRKSFSETMADGKAYWRRRFSNAHDSKNVIYDFPEKKKKDDSKPEEEHIETVEVNNDNPVVPRQTGQTDTTPGTPDILEQPTGEQPERPPTRQAWDEQGQ